MLVRRLRLLGLVGVVVLVTGVAVAIGLSGGSRPALSAAGAGLTTLPTPGPVAPTLVVADSPTAAIATTTGALPTVSPPPPAVAPPAAPGSTAKPGPTSSPKETGPSWLTTPSGPKPVTGTLLTWGINTEMSLTSYAADRLCFAVPVSLDDVNGGSVEAIDLTLTWPMPPGQNGPITGSSGSEPVEIGNGTTTTVNVDVCLAPILAQPVPAGRAQMVAQLTYYGDLANGATSQSAGFDDFTY